MYSNIIIPVGINLHKSGNLRQYLFFILLLRDNGSHRPGGDTLYSC
jgi:hypothetical protein